MGLNFDDSDEPDWLQSDNKLPEKSYDRIEYWKGCQSYCHNGEKNKACWRVDKQCNNLWNCSSNYMQHYASEMAKWAIFKAMHDVPEHEWIY